MTTTFLLLALVVGVVRCEVFETADAAMRAAEKELGTFGEEVGSTNDELMKEAANEALHMAEDAETSSDVEVDGIKVDLGNTEQLAKSHNAAVRGLDAPTSPAERTDDDTLSQLNENARVQQTNVDEIRPARRRATPLQPMRPVAPTYADQPESEMDKIPSLASMVQAVEGGDTAPSKDVSRGDASEGDVMKRLRSRIMGGAGTDSGATSASNQASQQIVVQSPGSSVSPLQQQGQQQPPPPVLPPLRIGLSSAMPTAQQQMQLSATPATPPFFGAPQQLLLQQSNGMMPQMYARSGTNDRFSLSRQQYGGSPMPDMSVIAQQQSSLGQPMMNNMLPQQAPVQPNMMQMPPQYAGPGISPQMAPIQQPNMFPPQMPTAQITQQMGQMTAASAPQQPFAAVPHPMLQLPYGSGGSLQQMQAQLPTGMQAGSNMGMSQFPFQPPLTPQQLPFQPLGGQQSAMSLGIGQQAQQRPSSFNSMMMETPSPAMPHSMPQNAAVGSMQQAFPGGGYGAQQMGDVQMTTAGPYGQGLGGVQASPMDNFHEPDYSAPRYDSRVTNLLEDGLMGSDDATKGQGDDDTDQSDGEMSADAYEDRAKSTMSDAHSTHHIRHKPVVHDQ